MPVGVAALVLLSCRHKPPPATDASGADDAPTAATGSWGPSGDTLGSETGLSPLEPLAPSARVIAPAGLEFARTGVMVMAATSGEVPVLGAQADSPLQLVKGLPPTLFLPANVGKGDHALLDVWDGSSGLTWLPPLEDLLPIQDDDGDGLGAVWATGRLMPAPLLGSTRAPSDAQATVAESDGVSVAAGFDADRDGFDDILTMGGDGLAVLRYGPFSGDLPAHDEGDGPADPATLSTFGQIGCSTRAHAWVLRDHLGPGHHAVVVGSSSTSCTDTFVYDLMQPRGARIPQSQAIATFEDTGGLLTGAYFDDVGDLDGDGQPDLLWGQANKGYLIKGPVQGEHYTADDPPWPEALDLVTGGLPGARYGIGDLNGDGIQELTALFRTDLDEASSEWWVVMFSPHADPLDPSSGLPIGRRVDLSYSTSTFGLWHVDLDSDGLPDLVEDWQYDGWGSADPATVPEELWDAGEIRIWFGADLLAAWDARN